jgi:hypothetical protein
MESTPQRLKPHSFSGPDGTIEVVPFPTSLFVDLAVFHYELNCFECANVG